MPSPEWEVMLRETVDAIKDYITRLGRLEGQTSELSKALQDLRAGQRQIMLAVLGLGIAQIGLLATLVVRISG